MQEWNSLSDFSLLHGASMDPTSESIEQTPDDVFRMAVVFESALGVLAILLGWTLGPDPRELVPQLSADGLRPLGLGLLYGLAAAVPMLIVVAVVRRLPFEPVRELERLSDDGMVKLLLKLSPTELIVISLCAGVGEELLFRGWMMPWLAGGHETTWNLNLAVGLIGSSIAFGLVHPITKLYVLLATLMGAYFGWLAIFTGNLIVPICAHAAYDAAQLLITSYRDQDE